MTTSTVTSIVTTGIDLIHVPGREPVHAHPAHELLWQVSGTFRVEADGHSWAVAPGTGLWVAADTAHRTIGAAAYGCGWALVDVEACPAMWARTTPVVIEPLLRGLLAHLATERANTIRAEAEAVVLDLLRPQVASLAGELPLPRDARCRRIVEAVLADPGHPWELAEWAVEVGASPRTLSRLFQGETGMSFGQWRMHARVRAAVADLADGLPVSVVARRVGYRTPSAFVTAFRRFTGRTPGAFAADGHLDVLAS